MISGLETTAKEVWKLTAQECAAIDVSQFDVVVAQPLHSERYGAVSYKHLSQITSRTPVHFIHNLHFDGLSPDCTYLGPLGKRLSGPMGTYHSRTIVYSFKNGKSIDECVAFMRRGAGIRPQETWSASIAELQKREAGVSVHFVTELISQVKERNSFHVFNHPRANLLARYAEKIATVAFGVTPSFQNSELEDELAFAGSWPVFSYLSEALGLDYAQEHFIIPRYSSSPVTPYEFVELCFEHYATIGADKLVRA